MHDEFDMDDITGDPNRGAYQKQEFRHGAPLSYVGEKMGSSLQELHRAIDVLGTAEVEDGKQKSLMRSLRGAFQYELVAYCALHNLLAMVNDPGLSERLLARSAAEFEDWLAQTADEGSVTG